MTLNVDNRFVKITIERALRDLPPLSMAVSKLLIHLEDPNVDYKELEDLISTDVALTARVLRVVNSPYYGLSGRVGSISQAVLVLGIQQVKNLVLGMGAVASVPGNAADRDKRLKCFWQHSFGAATAARCICEYKRISPKDTETVFLGGLLHDVGRLFLSVSFAKLYSEIEGVAKAQNLELSATELKYMGVTHAQVGMEMAKLWRLPPDLIDLIGSHESQLDPAKPLNSSIQVADDLTSGYYNDLMTDGELTPEASTWLAMSEEELVGLRQQIRTKVEETGAFLGLLAA